ncbi:MAG: CvpA family protein [Alphaproteobacteria bacterium]|nr:CvpA family protein [Alphaproteobacteria bacterium]
MNGVDIGVIVIVLISAGIGLIRGLTREVLSVVSWLGAAVATLIALPLAQNIARQHISNPMMADVATAAVVFILFLIIFSLISHFLSGLIRQSALGGIDRSLGFGFGIVRGIIFLCFLEITMSCFVSRANQPSSVKESRFTSAIYQGSDLLFQIFPSSLQNFITLQHQRRSNETNANTPSSSATTEVVESLLKTQLEQHLQHVAPPNKEEKKIETQRVAEDLAQLKPKAPEPQDANRYSKKQRQDMERLLALEESPE